MDQKFCTTIMSADPRKSLRPRESHPGGIPDDPGLSRIKTFDRPQPQNWQNARPTITIEQYMTLFRRIYDHVQNRHPGRATLLTQSTLGSGLHGPEELESMVNLGLTDFDPRHVIIAINLYDLDHAGQYPGRHCQLGANGALLSLRGRAASLKLADARHRIPFDKRPRPKQAVVNRAQQMSADSEEILYDAMDGREALQMGG